MSKSENIALYKYLTRPSSLIGRPPKPVSAMQENIAQTLYQQPFEELSKERKAGIRTGKITLKSDPFKTLSPQERINLTKEKMQKFVFDFQKERGRLPSQQEVRNIGKFDFETIKKYVKEGVVEIGELGATRGLNDPKVIAVKEHLKILDKNNYIKNSFQKGQLPNLNEVTKILGVKDRTIAAERIAQLADTYTGNYSVEGIKPKFQEKSKMIADQADVQYGKVLRRLRELKIGRSVGEKSISTTKNTIKRLLQDAYPEGASYAIDEPAGVASSVRRATEPYGAFGQIIDSEINKGLKYEFDRRKSVLEKSLQDAIENGTPAEKKSAVKKFNDVVSEYETKLNEGVKPGQKRIKLFKVSLNNPEKTIANYSELSDSYKDAFQKNYKTRGYAFQVPKDIKPLSQIADELKIEENRAKLSKAAFKGDKRVYSTFLPGADIVESLVDITGEGLKDIGKGAMKLSPGLVGKGLVKLIPGAGTAYGIYDTAVAFQEGKSIPEMAYRFVGADPLYNMVTEYKRLPEEAQAIQKKKNLQESFDAAGKDIIDEGLVQMFGRPEITPEEDLYLKQEKQKVQQKIEQENKDRAAGRHGYIQQLKSSFTNEPIELAKGGRVFLKDGSKPFNPGRRKFIKFAASLAALPFLGKFIKPATKAAPEVVEAISKTAESVPTYLNDLISKIKMMGSSKVLGKADNPEGFVKYQLGDYEVTDGSNFTRVKRVKDQGDYGYQEFEMELRKDPETGGLEYEEISVKPDRDGKLKDFEFGIDDYDHNDMKKFTYDD